MREEGTSQRVEWLVAGLGGDRCSGERDEVRKVGGSQLSQDLECVLENLAALQKAKGNGAEF